MRVENNLSQLEAHSDTPQRVSWYCQMPFRASQRPSLGLVLSTLPATRSVRSIRAWVMRVLPMPIVLIYPLVQSEQPLDSKPISSAYRTVGGQCCLYEGWIARRPGLNFALVPGHSLHELGLAIDFDATAYV